MTNTMGDLRREVASRLRDTLHGREIDTMEKGMPEMEHMLGLVTMGAISTEEALTGTLLDCDHEFWSDYYKDIRADGQAEREIESAIRSLKEEGVFRVETPYGEDAGIWYCEVDEPDSPDREFLTQCDECGMQLTVKPEIENKRNSYQFRIKVDCPSCGYTGAYGTSLHRL